MSLSRPLAGAVERIVTRTGIIESCATREGISTDSTSTSFVTLYSIGTMSTGVDNTAFSIDPAVETPSEISTILPLESDGIRD